MNRENGRKFKKLISRVLIFSLCFSGVVSLQLKSENVQAKTNSQKTKKEYLVKVDKDQNIKEIEKHNELEVLDADINDNQYFVIHSDEKLLENMEETYDVIYEQDTVVTASSNKKIVVKDWNYKQIELNRHKSKHNKNKPTKGKNEKVKVAVLDSGIDMYGDIDVSESVNFVEDEQDILPVFQDLTGHGTSIAGIIAANKNDNGITGINPNVELYSVKVFDMNNEAPMSRIIEGINWCVEHNVDIINMSFGTPRYSKILEEAIRYADKNGILMVAAAGNRGTVDSKDCIDYPAAYEEVLSVGSIASNGERAEDSSTGAELDIMAPGELIESTGAFDGTVIASGTSMAVPHVVGVAALLLEKDKNVSTKFIRDLIKKSAKQVGEKEQYGYGILDYDYAQKIYPKFKKEYQESEIVSEGRNSGKVKEYDTSGYVEGSWSRTIHENTAKYAANHTTKNWTTTQIKVLKSGAAIPDTYFNGSGSKCVYACEYLHGLGNYVGDTIYLANLAKVGFDGNVHNVPQTFSGVNNAQEQLEIAKLNRVKDIVKGNWKKYLPPKCEATKYNKRLLALGMAMHSLGDAYAHRAWTILNTPQGTRWVDLKDDEYYKAKLGASHHSSMCENYEEYGRMRMNAVRAGCKRLLQNFIDEKWNTYTVFMDTARPIADYRLEDLYACCERVNPSSVTGKYRQYIIDNTSPLFTGGGITRPCVPY